MSVAIVIPSYNRPAKIRACLACLEKLDGGPYRTIVVDDGGDMPLAPVVGEFGPHVSCLRLENSGPGAARNAGARAAEGAEFLCFLDDDCFARPDWAMRLLAAQGGVEKRLVGGRVENALEENVYSSASQSLSSFLYEFYQSSGSDMNFFTTNNMCCRRADFLEIGGFELVILYRLRGSRSQPALEGLGRDARLCGGGGDRPCPRSDVPQLLAPACQLRPGGAEIAPHHGRPRRCAAQDRIRGVLFRHGQLSGTEKIAGRHRPGRSRGAQPGRDGGWLSRSDSKRPARPTDHLRGR